MLAKLSNEGKQQFLRHANRTFHVRFHPLTSKYVKAKRCGQREWIIYWAGFFNLMKPKIG